MMAGRVLSLPEPLADPLPGGWLVHQARPGTLPTAGPDTVCTDAPGSWRIGVNAVISPHMQPTTGPRPVRIRSSSKRETAASVVPRFGDHGIAHCVSVTIMERLIAGAGAAWGCTRWSAVDPSLKRALRPVATTSGSIFARRNPSVPLQLDLQQDLDDSRRSPLAHQRWPWRDGNRLARDLQIAQRGGPGRSHISGVSTRTLR
jgi:hypothetical protein